MTSPATESAIAPGARIVVRDAEWLVRRVDQSSTGGKALTCVGLSELVKDKEAVFLTKVEALREPVKVLDPAETKLVPDTSNHYQDSLLYLESLLRQTPPIDPPSEANLYIGHKAAMDVVPYQLDPAIQALEKPRQRILIADSVGLGKTMEAGILLSELIRRGRGKRILVVTMKSMLTQFQKELWTRFTIPLTRLDSIGLQRVRSRIPTNHNPFHTIDKSIVSIDTLKQDNEFRVHLEKATWDIIVIDEAQNVAERGHGRTQRARLAKLLSKQSDSLIMLSATPHDGRARSFASLMNMLDPTAIANPDNYVKDDIEGLFIRRFKKDIQDQVKGSFQERRVGSCYVQASSAEEQAFQHLGGLELGTLDRRKGGGQLFRTTLEKALFSSPEACLETIDARLHQLRKKEDPAYASDIEALENLRDDVAAIGPQEFSRFKKLVQLLKDPSSDLHWTGRDRTDRLVIFTERIATLNFLLENLPAELGLKEKQVEVLHGELSDQEQQRIVEDFGREQSPVRLLIASDVASEGINLHYLSHRLIHFDIPWSLMVFQQRNGRIDRYGQERTPYISYLVIQSQTPKIHGDIRILELLINKDEEAVKNIGDPSALMGVYDVEAEEEKTAEALQKDMAPEDFEKEALAGHGDDQLDLLAFLEQGQEFQQKESSSFDRLRSMPSLFEDDFTYVTKALSRLGQEHEIDSEQRVLAMNQSENLSYRFRPLPREIQPSNGYLKLTDDTDVMQKEISRCRKDEKAWPNLHFLWPLHPIMEWINDQAQTSFSRHEAPVLTLPTLERDELIFLMTGILPNQKGQPLIQRWFGMTIKQERLQEIETLESVLERTGIARERFANPGDAKVSEKARKLLPQVVHRAQGYMSQERRSFEEKLNPQLNDQLNRLETLKRRHREEITAYYDVQKVSESIKNRQKEQKLREVDDLFAEYMQWIEESMSTEDQAYIKVAAILQG
jgi:ERCC4-related helicase